MVAEAAYLIGRRLCPTAEAAFFRSVARGDLLVEPMTAADLGRIADLVERYVDLPLGRADASLVALAERLKETRIATLDHRHFRVVRPVHVPGFELVP